MKKYYKFRNHSYQYGSVHVYLDEYYLLKEGWILVKDYRDDPNDSHYVVDSYGTPGNRKDYCLDISKTNNEEFFETKKECIDFALKKMEEVYKTENFKLFKAINKSIEKIKNWEMNNGK